MRIRKTILNEIIIKLQKKLQPLNVEHIMVVDINPDGYPTHYITLAKGSLHECKLKMTTLASHIERYNPYAIIIAHNHPNNLGFPSENDNNITKSFVETCKDCHIKFLDHIIILKDYDDYYFSFASNEYYMELTGMKRKKKNQEDHYE